MAALASRLDAFLNAARERDVPVIHVMANYDGKHMNYRMHKRPYRLGVSSYCQPDTKAIEFHPGLEPLDGEAIVVKHLFDALCGTELDLILRSRGVRTLVLADVAVQGYVDSTARHA